MSFASPGVQIKEVDLTPTINVSDRNVGAIVIPAETGPVDTVTFISSEKELVEVFGRPNDNNFESWFAASTLIQYGGIAAVVRPSYSVDSIPQLRTSIESGNSTIVNINNRFTYDELDASTGPSFKFAGRSPGALFNSLKVVAVDHGADQIITYTGTDPTVAAGDAIIIKNGSATVGTGWVYKINTTSNKLFITLNSTTQRIPISGLSTYSITDNGSSPATLIAEGAISGVDNSYYDTLTYAPNLKWRDIAPQPGTSSSVATKGGKFDEMHILVIDEDGIITGTPNAVLEKYLYVSKAKDASTLDGKSVYFHSTILDRSKYIFPGHRTGTDFISTSSILLESASTAIIGETNSANKVYKLIDVSGISVISFSLASGSDYNYTTHTSVITAAVRNGYLYFSSSETFNDVDFLIPGLIDDETATALIDIAESRKDCMAVISPRRSDVIGSQSSSVKTNNIVDFFKGVASSSYAIFDSGYKYLYDKYTDVYRWVPCAADVAGLCISTSINSETWFSPAGYNRGNLRNATKLAYSPNQVQRDDLYTNRINPIVSFPGQGIVLFGDKTALENPSAFTRINVRRLFIELQKNIGRFSKFLLFEINDETSRSSFKATVEPYLRSVQGRRGIFDYLLVCDDTNNPPASVDNHEFNAEIYIKPARSINYITITFIATRTGISFSELTS